MPPAAELRTPSPRELVGGKQRQFIISLHNDREWWDLDSFTTTSECSTQFTESLLLGDRPSWKDSMRRLHWCCLPFVSRRQVREDFLSQVAVPVNEVTCTNNTEEKLQLHSGAAAVPPPPPPPPMDAVFTAPEVPHESVADIDSQPHPPVQTLQRAVSQTGRPPRAGISNRPTPVERVSSAPSPTVVPKSINTTNAARSRPVLPPRAPSALAAARQVSAASSSNHPRRRANTLASRDVSTASTHRRQIYESFQFSVDTLQAIYNPKEEPLTNLTMTAPPQMINITTMGTSEFHSDDWENNDDEDDLSMDSLRLSSDEEDDGGVDREKNDDDTDSCCHKSQEKDRRSPDSVVVDDKHHLIAPWMMAWMKGTSSGATTTATSTSSLEEEEPLQDVCGTAYLSHSIEELNSRQELVQYSVVRTRHALKVIATGNETTKSLYLKKTKQDSCFVSTQYVDGGDDDCGSFCVQIQGSDSQGRAETWYLLPHNYNKKEDDGSEKEQCVSSIHLRFALDAAYMALVKGTTLIC